MNKALIKTLNVAIVSVYLIFLAGSVVRMTGSGMGCPDWPKCFGYYIPPTSEEQLLWQPNTSFHKGAIIIHNEALFVAEQDLTTQQNFNSKNWEAYTKHEYAVFNVYHTWTEYVNRLASVVSGFVFLILLFRVTFTKNKVAGVASLVYVAFLGMLFEAWLGKVVVDSFLTPYIITFHMIGGLVIIGLLLRARFLVKQSDLSTGYKFNKLFHRLLYVSLLMMIFQILLGTQVRQFVDEQVKLYGFDHKKLSLLDPSFKFYFHRSFTIIVVIVNLMLYWYNKKFLLKFKQVNWILALLFFEAFTGILMYYVRFPFGTQAIHLLSGALMFGVLLHMIFISNRLNRFKS
ncbi:COX15/CtaA family protein [Ochrovirga pacifica]|uniref:COX15/CtaA family protein n=1 Tax=Ochrovirga pacifica TaxID=1042376 RepID=UPI0002559552|nr:COX15/CtaA family protein [Ochrovirga pacifica]